MRRYLSVGAASALCLFVSGCTSNVVDEGPVDEASDAIVDSGDFGVDFTDCVESIGVALVPTANAQALTPPGYILVGGADPVTPLVVRTAFCEGISVDGSHPKRGSVVQIGAVIVPPDFTGDINNYTYWYYTTSSKLAHRLQSVGVAAQHVANIDYDYEACGPAPHSFEVRVPKPGNPRLHLEGTVTEGAGPPGAFDANWWRKAGADGVKMETNVPQITVGTADLVLDANPASALGVLVGGTTLTFPILQQFNTFPAAHMDVTTM